MRGCWNLYVLEEIFVMDLEVSMFEFPCLEVRKGNAPDIPHLHTYLHLHPRCSVLYESRICEGQIRTSRIDYLFNCRTKLAKLECLKCRGKTVFVNSLF